MVDGKMNGEVCLRRTDNKEIFKGKMKDWIRVGEGILVKNGKEYFIKYDDQGNQIGEKKRTFKGVRLMIGF
jgi:Zn/Cd-binding protein ZinT